MDTAAVDLITISREYGAGGSELATALNARLGWRVLDRNLVKQVADRLQLDPRTVTIMDEHPPGILARISSTLLITRPQWTGAVDTGEFLSPDAVAEASRAAMLEAVKSPPAIIVGHGSQGLFANRPGTFHVRLVAPLESRQRRILAREPHAHGDAVNAIRHMDADRAAYVRRYYHRDWRDPLLYDIQLNTGKITIDRAADTIVRLMRG